MNTGLALEILDDILQSIEVIYPNPESLAIFLKLMESYEPRGLKVHDVEVISIGLSADIHRVATFNEKDFRDINEINVLEI